MMSDEPIKPPPVISRLSPNVIPNEVRNLDPSPSAQDDKENKVFIHSTAIVDPGAQIGASTKIWHFSHVCATAQMGERCVLGQNVFVGDRVIIGHNVKIQNNVSIYEGVILEDDVFCGPSMVFTNVYNPRSAIIRRNEYKQTVVKKGATLGANCTIVCGITIGDCAFIGAGAVVLKDVPPYALMVGNPAVQKGWMGDYGVRLVNSGQKEWQCPQTKTIYRETTVGLEKVYDRLC